MENKMIESNKELPVFNSEARCIKCGYDSIGTSFHVGASISSYDRCYHVRDGVEHIDRICRRCHYKWTEAPLDSKDQNENQS